jgi:hypothetical protein
VEQLKSASLSSRKKAARRPTIVHAALSAALDI